MQDEIQRAGALIAAQRKQITRPCAVCGAVVTGTAKRRYCSNACKLRAARERKRGAQSDGQSGS